MVEQLSEEEKELLVHHLTSQSEAEQGLEQYLTDKRFSGGRFCPICGGTHVLRNGHRKSGAQKFICKDC